MFNEYSVDEIEVWSNIVNTDTLWIAPNDDGRWDLKSVHVFNDQDDVFAFDVNTVFSEAIQLTSTPQNTDIATTSNKTEYTQFQKATMDNQLIVSCATTVVCALTNPEYVVVFLSSTTVGTIYLLLLEKQVETLGMSPFASLLTYLTRMILVNGFLIHSFTEYSKNNEVSYLLVSAIGFFLYRITLILTSLMGAEQPSVDDTPNRLK